MDSDDRSEDGSDDEQDAPDSGSRVDEVAPGSSSSAAADGGRWAAVRHEVGLVVELAALVGLAVVQPVLGPFGESPETFVASGASSGDIILFALLVGVVPLLGLAVVGAITRWFGPKVRMYVQTALVGALAALGVTAIVRRFDVGAEVRLLAALGVALVAMALYRRWEPGRLFLRFASPLPLLLVAMFLFASPVAPLVRPSSETVAEGATNDHAPVLFVVLDELPTVSLMDGRGGVDREMFPNLARLADTSTWYRNHTSVSDKTLVSVPSIATGTFPEPGPERPVVESVYPDNVATLFAPTHDVHAVEWISELCPKSMCPADDIEIDAEAASLLDAPIELANPLSSLVTEAQELWWEQVWPFASPSGTDFALAGVSEVGEVVEPGLQFLSGMEESSGGRPVLDYLHVPVPHQPWRLLPSGGNYDGPNPAPGSEYLSWGSDTLGEQLGLAARSRHLLQLQWTDRLVGQIIDRMEDLGRWDDATVVFTADHGVSFGAGQSLRNATAQNQSDIYWTPLFVKAPHQADAAVVDDNVMSVDILPTVADLVGIELDVETDGVSLVDPIPADRDKRAHASQPEAFDVQDGSDDGLVQLDESVLDEILRAGEAADASDELRPWRHGRHGDLIGREVDELGVCGSGGPELDYEPPATWGAYVGGTLDRSSEPLPLWHEARVTTDDPIDVAVAHGGRIVAWNVARPRDDGAAAVGLLLTEPLVEGVEGAPQLYQVVDEGECALSPLGG